MRLGNLILLSLIVHLNYFKAGYRPYSGIYEFLSSFSKSSIRAGIQLLLHEGEVEKIIKNGQAYFSLTLKGFKTCSGHYLRTYFGFKKPWDGKWRMIIFDIPEKRREVRGKLRQLLFKLGFGRLANSIYISPLDNLVATLAELKRLIGRENHLFSFEVRGLVDNKNLARTAFKLEELAQRYETWIKKAQRTSEEFDILISYYDAILKSDPALPEELLPANWPLLKSWKIFLSFLGKKLKKSAKKTGNTKE